MLVTAKAIQQHPEKVQQLVTAHARATRFLQQHPEQWIDRAASFGTEKIVLNQAAKNIELSWAMDSDFIDRARALGQRMQALGMIERHPDYDRLFDLRFVKQAQTELNH